MVHRLCQFTSGFAFEMARIYESFIWYTYVLEKLVQSEERVYELYDISIEASRKPLEVSSDYNIQ